MGWESTIALEGPLDAALAKSEARFADLRPDHGKEVIWAGQPDVQTDISVVYVHGFSASKAEIRPVPDRVAGHFGANLFFTRLPGHGRNERAMGETELSEWYACLDEALEVGTRIGKRVVLISCSTGGTLVAAGLSDIARQKDVSATVFVAPNFRVNSRLINLALLPGAAHWMERVAGQRYSFEPRNEEQARWWTTSYPPSSAVPMVQLVRDVKKASLENIKVPALALFSDADQVVDARATHKTLARWGGSVTRVPVPEGEGVDALSHVVMGDIVSPANTDWGVTEIVSWLKHQLP